MVTHCSLLKLSLYQLNLLLFLIALKSIAAANFEDPLAIMYALCSDTETVSSNSIYQANINTTLSFLSSNSSNKSHFYNTTVGSGADKVYGLFFCRYDVIDDVCQQCVSPAIVSINTRCPGQKNAVIWYSDKCMVRYAHEPFLGIMDATLMIPMWNRRNQSMSLDISDVTNNMGGFTQVLLNTLDAAADQATGSPDAIRFATRGGIFRDTLMKFNTIYVLSECTPDITLSDCKHCLRATIGNITDLCNLSAGCTLMCLSCDIRYDLYPFHGDTLKDSPGTSPDPVFRGTGRSMSNRRALLISVMTAAAVITMITSGLIYFACKRKKTEISLNDCNDIETLESLKFQFGEIRSATKNFSDDQKLGEGGFGEVFKGKLQSGQEIAVKRLSRKSRQGAKEFETEVHLVAKLQHRNLVKLLGFCLAKQEKLLIYEFCTNSSLDQLLFDPMRCLTLNWDTRFKIICGIARGLLYLHEDSRLKIIHRDLKAGNVLLDNDMIPKISDFGMARLCGEDETQGNTNKVAGTFGYMAPEYVIAGQYSVKSDVYSFGIIVLEIISGQRNKFFRTQNDEESLLHRAWRLWTENSVMELVDKTMENNLSREEAAKCIHIGLLCIQEDAARRPRMTSVVSALNGDVIVLPSPNSPHCFMTDTHGIEERGTDQSGVTFTGAKTITVLNAR